MRSVVICLLVSVLGLFLISGCGRKTEQTEAAGAAVKKTITEAELGLPIYPGATLKSEMKMATEKGETNIRLVTPDSYSKVVQFYKAKLKGATVTTGKDFYSETTRFIVQKDGQAFKLSVTSVVKKSPGTIISVLKSTK